MINEKARKNSPIGGRGAVLELATIDIKTGTNAEFEENLAKAQAVISQSKGYLGHQFQKCVEQENRYVLLIRWESVEAHTIGFRGSELFKEWRALIGPFFENPPVVLHYSPLTPERGI
ncbi:MAG TPA: antibiotic biosynthesis monooxygenase [Runella sp.]|nr:antibiotic biosynthesis monooxygenase [Runella sp.]